MIAVAGWTAAEMIRRRFAFAALGGVLASAALTAWGFHALATFHRPSGSALTVAEVQGVTATLLPLLAYAMSFVLAFAAIVVGATMLSSEVESGVLLTVLARPVSRRAIVLGKALGIAAALSAYAALAGLLEFAAVFWMTGYAPPHPLAAVGALIALALVAMTLSLAIATRLQAVAGSVVAVLAFGAAWLAGIVASFGPVYHSAMLVRLGVIAQLLLPTDALWRVAVYQIQPPGLAARIAGHGWPGPFLVLAPPPPWMLLWTAIWIGAVLALAVWSFRARDV